MQPHVYMCGYFLITGPSVSDAMAVLNSPQFSSTLQSITVTCTIHPHSTADQCVVIAVDDGGVNRTGNEIILALWVCILKIKLCLWPGNSSVVNRMGVVTVNGLECGTNYTIIAGGTLNGVLVGPRSSHGNISTNPCPVCPAIGKIHHSNKYEWNIKYAVRDNTTYVVT